MNCRVSNGPTCRASPDRDGRGKQTENCRVYCVSVTVYSWKMGIFLIMGGARNSSWAISPVAALGFLKWGSNGEQKEMLGVQEILTHISKPSANREL